MNTWRLGNNVFLLYLALLSCTAEMYGYLIDVPSNSVRFFNLLHFFFGINLVQI